jgi:hypothetical protein
LSFENYVMNYPNDRTTAIHTSALILALIFTSPSFAGQVPVTNLELAHEPTSTFLGYGDKQFTISDGFVLVWVPEMAQGEVDLNGDGDLVRIEGGELAPWNSDRVLHTYDLASGEVFNTGLSLRLEIDTLMWSVSGRWLAFVVDETDVDQDLNGDGDIGSDCDGDGVIGFFEEGTVLHVRDLRTGETRNVGLPIAHDEADAVFRLVDDRVFLFVRESQQGGIDLNRDGDVGQDRDGNGEIDWFESDVVLHVYDIATEETRTVPVSGLSSYYAFPAISGDWIELFVHEYLEGADLNGDGDQDDRVVHVHRLSTETTTDLGLAGDWSVDTVPDIGRSVDKLPSRISDRWLSFLVDEAAQRDDLNSDGDTEDSVLHAHDLVNNSTLNFELAVSGSVQLTNQWVVVTVDERAQGKTDLNGDGDQDDHVVHVMDLETGTKTNLAIVSNRAWVSGRRLVFTGDEARTGRDMNEDGDRADHILHVRDLSSGNTVNVRLAGEVLSVSEEWIALLVSGELHVYNLRNGETWNLGHETFYAELQDGWLAFSVWEEIQGQDLNGDGDLEDYVVHIADLSDLELSMSFRRGDCNDDGTVDISDGICALNWLFADGSTPGCIAALNTNGDSDVDLSDAVWLLNYLFGGGPAPADPFPGCGPGSLAADDALGCMTPPKNCQP